METLSATSSGVKEVRSVVAGAREWADGGGGSTVLFIDEVHRFSKTQQDSLLAAVEDRTVILLAATTENPYFSVISPLLSRCVLLTLRPLDDAAVRGLLRRALVDERGLGGALTLAAEAEAEWHAHVVAMYEPFLLRKAQSWITGYNSNVPGHERGTMRYNIYNGGGPKYVARLAATAEAGYEGVTLE